MLTKKQGHNVEMIKRTAPLLLDYARKKAKRHSGARKRQMESLYQSLMGNAHKLRLNIPRISIGFDANQYSDHTLYILSQLHAFELEHGRSGWLVQPEGDTKINYTVFYQLFEMTREQIDALMETACQFYPLSPVCNRTVEWAILKQREMEGQHVVVHADYIPR